jgi:dolichol-phosphate mannosyltransferase
VRDPVSGFFAARREVLSAGRPLEGIGYKILLEVLVTRPRAQVVEVPYVFVNRARGRSKLGTGEIYNYVRLVGRLLRRGGRGP